MDRELKARVDIQANVGGQQAVDALNTSVDHLGAQAEQTGQQAAGAAVGVDQLGASAGRAGAAASGAAGKTKQVGSAAQEAAAEAVPANERIRASIKSIDTQLRFLLSTYAAVSGGGALGGMAVDLANVADAWQNLQAKLKITVGEGPQLASALQGVLDVALQTNASLENTARIFDKITKSGGELRITQAEALALTKTINQALQLSGESAEAGNAAVIQLTQGLQSGTLRGEEFNSVIEQAPRLAKALADGLGIAQGKLRELADTGQITTATVIRALQGQGRVIDEEFSKFPLTIGRSLNDLKTRWEEFIAKSDEAAGASRAVAQTIETLSKNLDGIAAALINAGQAWLAWKAYNIVAEFLGLRTAVLASAAAKGADTAATMANTAATAVNTQAQIGNAAARSRAAAAAVEGAAATTRLGGAIGNIKGLALAFVLTNLKDIGDWIAKTAYGFTDLARREKEMEREARAVEAATKAMALADAELVQKKTLAAEAALRLTDRSRKLIAEFEKGIKEGVAFGEVLKELAKALDLSDLRGIADAGAALDALALKGKLTAADVREAWQQALAGKDLRVFEAEVQAAFDGTDQGQRRLASAIDAILGEALRRTGKDTGELASGISAGAQKAINDFDVLLGKVSEIKARGLDVGITLAASLDQAAKAASTEAAMAAVIARWEDLGRQGLVAGEQLRRGLEGARDRLDELAPGITSVTEAFRALGMKAPEELRRTAETAKAAFDTILRSGTSTPAQIQAAFRRYAEAAIDANGGIVTDALRVEAAMRGLTIEVDAAGRAIIKAMGGGAGEAEKFARAVDRSADGVQRLAGAAGDLRSELTGSFSGRTGRGDSVTGRVDLRNAARELTPEQMRADGWSASDIQNYFSERKTSPDDRAAGLIQRPVIATSQETASIARAMGITGKAAIDAFVTAFEEDLPEQMAAMQAKLRGAVPISSESYIREWSGAFDRARDAAARAAAQARRQPDESRQRGNETRVASVHRVEVVNGKGKVVEIDTASPDAARSLIDTLTELSRRSA